MHLSRFPFFLRNRIARPWPRRALRILAWTAVGVYFLFAATVLILRHAVLPEIERYRGDLEVLLSSALNLPVTVRSVDAGWQGLRPALALHGVEIRDREGRPALDFDNVEAEFSWSSLWHFGLRLARLEIVAPEIEIRRDAAGRLFVAGLELGAESAGNGFSNWLLTQKRIVIRDATVHWRDEKRGAPALDLTRLNFDLQNDGRRHRFGFTAQPPSDMASRLDLRGDLRGDDFDQPSTWQGETYAELDHADLAIWRAWVDYPVELPHGNGGLRLWLGVAGGAANAVTADVRLTDVHLRLTPELPMLNLASLEGRIVAARQSDGYRIETRRLALATTEGLQPPPVNMTLSRRETDNGGEGRFEADDLDLGALATLAGHLPLDPALRARLADFAPQGRLRQLRLDWGGEGEWPERWRVKAEFDDLGLAPQGRSPGFSGFDGRIDGDEKSGHIDLSAHRAALHLPAVFSEPRLALDELTARVAWTRDAGGNELRLTRASFANADAAGEASGSYRWDATAAPGVIDLSARLARGAGAAVWRYMPLAVGKDVRDWLRGAIVGGKSTEVTLRLKGDLARFPFKDGKDGIFQVKGGFTGATLRYAAAWPEIREIDGELLFEGARMLIQGHKGSIFGVGVGQVRAEIADLESADELLGVSGKATGPTSDFLRYMEESPVGDRIDHFTEDMRAIGTGELALRLALPLRRLGDAKVDGRYRFANNQLLPDPDLPPLTEVNGELHFTADRLEAHKVRAALFGMPISVDVATTGDGSVTVKSAGNFNMRQLRQQTGHPVFDHLAGSAAWSGTVKARKKSADLRIESTLQGISSSLPEPLNKSVNDVLPLVFERKQGEGGRDQLSFGLGDAARAQLFRRHEGAAAVVERGAIAIGTAALKLPERGLALGVQVGRLDADFWRRLMPENGGSAPLPLTQIDLRCDELNVYNRAFSGVRIAATRGGDLWKADVRSRDAVGRVDWDGRGAGRLVGSFSQLSIPDAVAGQLADSGELPEEMPSIDLVAQHFQLRGKDFGELKLGAATTRDGYWQAKLDVRNADATLSGEGRWRPSRIAPETQLDFKLDVKSIEKLLTRLGYPDAVRRGAASAEGRVSWAGAPFAVDYPSLSGSLKFGAESGQFNKLEPGVGRLLGVLSLQALPRRLTLDFRDVFSEGFAFDAIAGSAKMAHGILDTRDLQIYGPSAKVSMGGTIGLVSETQDLRVRVQPTIGDTVATGVLLAHPVTGAATWVLNKMLGNPLDQAFAFEYAVTGPWADPKVEKLAGPTGREKDK